MSCIYKQGNKYAVYREQCMHDLTGFQRDPLYVIAGADQPSGQDVKEEVEQYYSTEINHGRLYPNIDWLVDEGFLEKSKRDTSYFKHMVTLFPLEILK